MHGQAAFVPNELPPVFDSAAILTRLVSATQALGELNGILRTLPDPYILIQPLQAREALTSSSMEGTYTTVDALLLAEAGYGASAEGGDTREVLNYSRALRNAVRSLDEIPLSLRTIKGAHRDLLQGVARARGAAIQAGEFKAHQNWIGTTSIEAARFVPAPPKEAYDALCKLELYIQRPDREAMPPLIDAALIHYQFEAIHPFADGNGRVGRILIPVALFERKALLHPALFISPVLERRKDEYIDHMFEVSRSGAWESWLGFFLSVVEETCRETITIADRLFLLRERYRKELQAAGRSALLLSIVDRLFTRPVFSIPQLAEHLGVTYPAAQKNLETVLSLGFVEEVPETVHPKFFAAREIMNTITGQS